MALSNIIKGQLKGGSYRGPCGKTHYFERLFYPEFPFLTLNSHCFPFEFPIEFPAPTCAPCHKMDSVFEKLAFPPSAILRFWVEQVQLSSWICTASYRFTPHRIIGCRPSTHSRKLKLAPVPDEKLKVPFYSRYLKPILA